jgi:hypothetical protein
VLRELGINARAHRKFLTSVVPGNLLGARINVNLTGLAMGFQRNRAYRMASSLVDRESRLELEDTDSEDVRRLAMEAQFSVLRHLEDAPVVNLDPRGVAAIALARGLRRQLRHVSQVHGAAGVREVARAESHARAYFRGLALAGLRGRPAPSREILASGRRHGSRPGAVAR